MGEEYPEFLAPTSDSAVPWKEHLYKEVPGDLDPQVRSQLDEILTNRAAAFQRKEGEMGRVAFPHAVDTGDAPPI